VGALLTLEIESLDLEGRGVARHEGKVVFVSGALPSERVTAEVIASKPKFDRARLVEVQRESSQRVVPRCPHFGQHAGACGGCSMQHLHADAQLAIKARALEDALWHIGRLRAQQQLPPLAGPAWNYRHRARLSVRFVVKKGGVLVGFHERGSSYVADMHECHVLPEKISVLLLPLRELVAALSIRDRMPQIELAMDARHVVLVFRNLAPLNDSDRQLLDRFGTEHQVAIWMQPQGPSTVQPLNAAHAVTLALDLPEFDVRLPFGPTEFTQVNPAINESLVGRALRLLEPQADEQLIDFFCGLGNFTLPMARRARRVIGIEGSAELVTRARAGAELHGLGSRCEFGVRNLFEFTAADWAALTQRHGPIDRVLIDPPREGAMAVAQVLAGLADKPRRIVYVSCNPATLARDCAHLVHEGGWTLLAAGVVNMFPHTAHVESIAVLVPTSAP
jgi:23S rRNA (uracil1939-C5)-methyltransferase